MADDQAGTPQATPDDAPAGGTPGTPSGDGSDTVSVDAKELQSLRNTREQFLREKDNSEAIRRENEYLRTIAEQAANRAQPPPTGYDQGLAQSIQNLQQRDPDVVNVLRAQAQATNEMLAKQQAEARYYRELDSIPPDKRAEVDRRSRSSNTWPSITYQGMKAELYDKELNDLTEQRRKLQEAEDRMRRNVVRTDAAPATKPPASSISMDEYDRVIESATRGDRDARKRLDEIERGTIEVRPG